MITVAKNAGFCFGVKRAVDTLLQTIQTKAKTEQIYTLGPLIHNTVFNEEMQSLGVMTISQEEIDELAKKASEKTPITVIIRAHGIPVDIQQKLSTLSEENEFFKFIDCTCPYVKKIHKIAQNHSSEDNVLLVFGKQDHPEVIGILSYFDF